MNLKSKVNKNQVARTLQGIIDHVKEVELTPEEIKAFDITIDSLVTTYNMSDRFIIEYNKVK